MNNEAFNRGFFKAAVDSGLDPIQAAVLTKQASGALGGGVLGAAGDRIGQQNIMPDARVY